ncbi:MAG: methylated-DNA--[protein]-cysteine S-methyltransferase [Terracidiphilus sp.]|nr:methylated-DNA--[protein]-cysteine S-methyltransferase [Terracidiphilus sp.]
MVLVSLKPQFEQASDPEAAWRAVCARDRSASFVYAVTSTGIYCRPGCSSRLPRRENTRFFLTPAAAEAAGFRPCFRCRPAAGDALDERGNTADSKAEKILRHLEANLDRRVSLAELASLSGLSPHAVRRLFTSRMGTSPLAYQRGLRAARLRTALKRGATVTDAIYAAGFSSSSRAYENSPLGMTPARFAQGGKGEQIGTTAVRTAFGWIAVGATVRGLCWLSLAATKDAAEQTIHEEFPAAELHRDPSLARWVELALEAVGSSEKLHHDKTSMELDLRGTAFQLRVWQALRKIPRGQTRTYSQLAREMGMPTATRAVARACAMNRVSMLVPCHRVVGASGSLTGYRWSVERKQKLLETEGARPSRLIREDSTR